MDKIDFLDADSAEKLIRLILSLPGTVLDYLFKAFSAIGFDFPASAKLILLLSLSLGVLTICYRHRNVFWAWPVGLYALLLALASLFQVLIFTWLLLFPPRLEVAGEIKVFNLTIVSTQGRVGGDWRSNDCGIRQTREAQRCGPEGKDLFPPFNVHIKSANCGSNVENVRVDPSNPTCLLVRERLTGCGYRRIFGIKECRGRGWIDYDVSTSTKSESIKLISSTKVEGSFEIGEPFLFEIPVPKDTEGSTINFEYIIDIKNADGNVSTVTNEKPSTKNIQSIIVGDKLRISINVADRVRE